MHKHEDYDGAVGISRGDLCRTWCLRYAFPRQKGFTYKKWGQKAANMYCREFCRRGQHFYNCYLLRDSDDFLYEDFHFEAYAEGDEWADWKATLDKESVLYEMACAISEIAPSN